MFWVRRTEGQPLWLIGIACRRRRKPYALPSTALIGFRHCVIAECKHLRIYAMLNACPRGLSLALWNNGMRLAAASFPQKLTHFARGLRELPSREGRTC